MRTGRYSPLRYPGGKGKLAPLMKAIITQNKLIDGTYIEPFAGGAGIACELLAENYVREIHINDLSPAIFSFWNAALWQPNRFAEAIAQVELTPAEWGRQKKNFERQRHSIQPDTFELGFSTFYLNRTNRSGILNGGMIGGKAQSSLWGLDARFNREDLVGRVRLLASMRDRIKLSRLDAISLLRKYKKNTPFRSLMYLDPPYFIKGRQLYFDYYRPSDHINISRAVQQSEQPFNWIVSYDNVEPIKSLYGTSRTVEYNINYSARSASVGSEVIFFDSELELPKLENFIQITRNIAA